MRAQPMEVAGAWALEATTDCVILLDREFRIVYVNRHAADLNKTTPEALVGKLHGEVWPQTSGVEVERRYRESLETGVPAHFEHGYLGDGAEVWHEIHAFPSEDGLAIFYRDLTEARRKETDRERLERAIHGAGLGVWRRDFITGVVRWSTRMREHFGLAPEAVVGPNTFDEHIHPDDRERALLAYREAIHKRVPYDALYRTLGDDGKMRTIHARGGASYAADGTPVRFDGFTLDVTERRETERRLQEAQARLEAALASADVAAWVLDLESGVMEGDPNLPILYGIDPSLGSKIPMGVYRERIHPEDVDTLGKSLSEAAERKIVWNVEYRIVDQGETVRWVNARGLPEVDAEGRIRRVTGVLVDVTALKRAEEREREVSDRLRRAVERQRFRVELMDALRGLSDAHEIVGVASRMVGEFLGVSRTTYGRVDLKSGTVETMTPYANGVAPISGSFNYTDYGQGLLPQIEIGRPFAVADVENDPITRAQYSDSFARIETRSFAVVPLFRNGALSATFNVHDRNVREWTPEERELLENVAQRTWETLERARAEDALRTLNAELEDRVRERTAELQQANDELQAFTSAVSHDLRGPLRNVHSMGQMLLEDAAERLNDDDRRLLQRQAHNVLRLGAMVDALLRLSRLGREPLNREPFDLSALGISVRDDLLAREPTIACPIEIAPNLRAVGDRRLIRLVLQNLLENACKFSPNGGKVQVGEKDGAFFVSDEGVGFDMAYASKLFQPFERLVSERQFPGTGIGLANVHRIITRHDGRVWAEAKPGEGATFWFTLPIPEHPDNAAHI